MTGKSERNREIDSTPALSSALRHSITITNWETGEGIGEIGQVIAFGAAGPDSQDARVDSEGLEPASQPAQCGKAEGIGCLLDARNLQPLPMNSFLRRDVADVQPWS